MNRLHRLSLDGAAYRFPRLCAWDQNELLGLAEPFFKALRRSGTKPEEVREAMLTGDVLSAAAALSDDEVARLLALGLRGVERQEGEAWIAVYDTDAGRVGDSTLDGLGAIRLAVAVTWANLGPLLTRQSFEIEREVRRLGFEAVTLPNRAQWLGAPLLRGMIAFESLRNGALDLTDIAWMNEIIAADVENQNRANQAARDEAQSQPR